MLRKKRNIVVEVVDTQGHSVLDNSSFQFGRTKAHLAHLALCDTADPLPEKARQAIVEHLLLTKGLRTCEGTGKHSWLQRLEALEHRKKLKSTRQTLPNSQLGRLVSLSLFSPHTFFFPTLPETQQPRPPQVPLNQFSRPWKCSCLQCYSSDSNRSLPNSADRPWCLQ